MATLRETVLVAVCVVGLVALQLAGTDSTYLLHKYFWTDELATYALLTDPDPAHAFRALRGSVDINPPGLHLLLLAFTAAQPVSEFSLRSFALLSMIVALLGLYVTLRHVFGVLVALAATLAVWNHPMIQDHAFEVRYYGPWLAAAIWFNLLLSRARTQNRSGWTPFALAVASFFLCTIHYFGIVTLLIVLASEWLWSRGQPRLSRGALAAVAIGPLATIASVIFLLPMQRAATTVSTWIPDPSPAAIVNFATTVFLPMHLGAVVMIAWLSRLSRSPVDLEAPHRDLPSIPPAIIGLTALALLVPVLVGFSVLVQSVLIGRYGLPAIAALAPAVAYATMRMSRPWLLVLVAFLTVSSAFQLQQRSVRARVADEGRHELIEQIRRTGHDRVVFEAPHQLNIVWHYAPDLRPRLALMDFEKGQLGDRVSRFRIWSRDLAKEFGKFYDGPPLVPWEDVRRDAPVLIVPHPEAYTTEPPADQRYPGFRMIQVAGNVHQLVRADAR